MRFGDLLRGLVSDLILLNCEKNGGIDRGEDCDCIFRTSINLFQSNCARFQSEFDITTEFRFKNRNADVLTERNVAASHNQSDV